MKVAGIESTTNRLKEYRLELFLCSLFNCFSICCNRRCFAAMPMRDTYVPNLSKSIHRRCHSLPMRINITTGHRRSFMSENHRDHRLWYMSLGEPRSHGMPKIMKSEILDSCLSKRVPPGCCNAADSSTFSIHKQKLVFASHCFHHRPQI